MALPEVNFVVRAGGLGRLPESDDHVSGIFIELTTAPTAWAGMLGKKYFSAEEAAADGITAGSAAYGVLYYQIKEFFRVAGASELWVVNAADDDFDAQAVYNLTDGKLRQVYWYTETNFAGIAAQVTTVQAMATALDALFSPCQFLISVKDETATVDGAAQPDIRALNAANVSVLIGGGNTGDAATLTASLGVKYIPAGGALLGAAAKAAVNESIAWVAKFNLQTGSELQGVVFADGISYGAKAASVLDTLNDKGYLFLKKHIGISGSYMNDSHTATVFTSDFATIENNRTLQKAKRGIRARLLPDLNSPLTVNEDGTLAADTLKYFENKTARPLELMQSAGELSQYDITIDPTQNVLATSKLIINVRIIPRGVARFIEVSLGYAVNF